MMFSATKKSSGNHAAKNKTKPSISKSRLKPKLFNHLKYLILIVFCIVLVSRLRATELPCSNNSVLQSVNNFTDFSLRGTKTVVDQNRPVEYPTELASLSGHYQSLDSQTENNITKPVVVEVLQDESTNHLITDKSNERVANNSQSVGHSSYDVHIAQPNDLLVAPTANNAQVQLISSEELGSSADLGALSNELNGDRDTVAKLGPTLAEITAASAAAGLLVHDLLSHAGRPAQENEFNPAGHSSKLGPDMRADNTIESLLSAATNYDANDDDESNSSARQQRKRLYSGDAQAQPMTYATVSAEDDEDGSTEADAEHAPPGEGQRHGSRPGQNRAAQQQRMPSVMTASTMDAVPEPPSEEQMPDSMDSLMQSEGESVDMTSGEEDTGADRQQVVAGTNLINQNQLMNVGEPTQPDQRERDLADLAREGIIIDGADERKDQDGIQIVRESRPQMEQLDSLDHETTFDAQDVPRIARALRGKALSDGLTNTNHQDNNPIAPMKDSLHDLNVAAGHYYGKKKKKVKKVFYKKKKKKYMKNKKIKLIKVVHKKKKKKKPITKKYHDHGKYHMYAKVPKKKAWEFGFKKGNKKHWIARHEKGYKSKFKTKVKWYDKKSKGKGVHIWDYNHHDKKKKKHY